MDFNDNDLTFKRRTIRQNILLIIVLVCLTLVRGPPAKADVIGKDGALMVVVPAGEFTMGGSSGILATYLIHKVYLDTFYIDVYGVTVSHYSQFLSHTGRKEPSFWYVNLDVPKDGNLPAIGMAWYEAAAYCEWAGKRLPTEAEWEKAGRGTDARLYPWGNDPPKRDWASFDPEHKIDRPPVPLREFLAPVGSYKIDKSPYEVYDLAGNVSEWTSDWYDYNYYAVSPYKNPKGPSGGGNKVYRGGSFDDVVLLTLANRRDYWPSGSAYNLGLRCAMDAPNIGVIR